MFRLNFFVATISADQNYAEGSTIGLFLRFI